MKKRLLSLTAAILSHNPVILLDFSLTAAFG